MKNQTKDHCKRADCQYYDHQHHDHNCSVSDTKYRKQNTCTLYGKKEQEAS